METDSTEPKETTKLETDSLYASLARTMELLGFERKPQPKTPDQLAEDFIKENKVLRALDIPIEIANPLTADNLDQINLSYIEALPDSPGKDQAYFLYQLIQQAALAIQSAEHTAHQWRSKADAFQLCWIKESWIKQTLRETGGNLGRY